MKALIDQWEVSILMVSLFVLGLFVFLSAYINGNKKAKEAGLNLWELSTVRFSILVLVATTVFSIWMLFWILGYVS